MMELEIRPDLTTLSHTLLQGEAITDYLVAYPDILTDMTSLYIAVFGAEPWNEWVRLQGNHEELPQTLGRLAYNLLPVHTQQMYTPFYDIENLKRRLLDELSPTGQTPFLLLEEEYIPEASPYRLYGMTFGSKAEIPFLLERIMRANYSTPSLELEWERTNQTLCYNLQKTFQRRAPWYIDETLLAPDRQGITKYTINHFGNLYRMLAEYCPDPDGSLPIFYRTSEESRMGRMSETMLRSGLLQLLHRHQTDGSTIIYCGGIIPPETVNMLKTHPNIVKALISL